MDLETMMCLREEEGDSLLGTPPTTPSAEYVDSSRVLEREYRPYAAHEVSKGKICPYRREGGFVLLKQGSRVSSLSALVSL